MESGPRQSVRALHLPALDHPIYACALGAAVGFFLLLTMRNATAWDGDDALYIMNARNIVLGLPYAQTGYIVNPDNVINPAAYPPGLPLLLAPIYWLYGVSFIKMKALCVVCFAAFIAVFCRMLLLYVPPALALATAAALGFHPFIWDFKDALYSELPFMLACYAALLLIHRAQTRLRPSVPLLLGAAMLLAAAYLIRTVGIVLFPAALLAAVRLPKRAVAATFAIAAAAGLLAWTVQRFFPADIGTYVGYFKDFSLQGVRTAVLRYLGIKRTLIGSAATSARPHIAAVMVVVAGLLISVGFLHRLRRVTVVEIFFIGYWALLLTYPISLEQGRYSLPVWPLIFLYFSTGLSLVMHWIGPRAGRLFASLVFGAVMVCYVAQFRIEFSAPIAYPIEAPESRAMFEAVRKEVPSDAAILARKPTTIALFTGRSATVWGLHGDDRSLQQYMARTHVHYILQERFPVLELNADPNALLNGFVSRNAAALVPVFTNDWYVLYRLR